MHVVGRKLGVVLALATIAFMRACFGVPVLYFRPYCCGMIVVYATRAVVALPRAHVLPGWRQTLGFEVLHCREINDVWW